MHVIVVKRQNTDSYNAPPPQVVAIAVDDAAAIQWVQDEVDGKHPSGWSYAQGHDASWWIDYGTFALEKTEVIGS